MRQDLFLSNANSFFDKLCELDFLSDDNLFRSPIEISNRSTFSYDWSELHTDSYRKGPPLYNDYIHTILLFNCYKKSQI